MSEINLLRSVIDALRAAYTDESAVVGTAMDVYILAPRC